MVAHYSADEPKIFTVSLSIGIASKTKGIFEAIGSGSPLAIYLLSDMCIPDLDYETASVLAVHTVEIVKRHDIYCGGPTKLGIVRKPILKEAMGFKPSDILNFLGAYYTPPLILPQLETVEIVKMVSDVELAIKEKRGELIRNALKQKSQKKVGELLKQFAEIGKTEQK